MDEEDEAEPLPLPTELGLNRFQDKSDLMFDDKSVLLFDMSAEYVGAGGTTVFALLLFGSLCLAFTCSR